MKPGQYYWLNQPPGAGNPYANANPNEEHLPFYYCPTMSALGFTGDPPTGIGRGWYTNYAINFQVFGKPSQMNSEAFRPKKLSEFKAPSQVGSLWDTRGVIAPPNRHVGANLLYQITSGNPSSAIGYVHGGSKVTPDLLFLGGASNTLFLDAHSEAVPDPGFGEPHPIATSTTNTQTVLLYE